MIVYFIYHDRCKTNFIDKANVDLYIFKMS